MTSLMDEARCYEALPITAKTIGQRTQDSMWHSAARLLLQPNLALIRKVLFAIRAESGGNCVEHGKLKTARRTVCAESASRSEISRGVGAGSPLASLSRTNSNTRRWIWVNSFISSQMASITAGVCQLGFRARVHLTVHSLVPNEESARFAIKKSEFS